jgi:hypothetical protein
LLPARSNSGNRLFFYSLPINIPTVPGTDTIICLLGGSSQWRIKISKEFILSQKKYPEP